MWWTFAMAWAQSPTATELSGMRWLSSPTWLPDGRVLVRSGQWTFDPEAGPGSDTRGGWTSEVGLWVVSEDAEPRLLTRGDAAAGSPAVSPDGRVVAFVRDGALNLLPLGGGEARVVELELTPSALAFGDDGTLWFLGVPEPEEDEAKARFARGDAYRFERDTDRARLYSLALPDGEPVARTQGAAFHVTAFDTSVSGDLALTTAAEDTPYDRIIEPELQLLASDTRQSVTSGCVASAQFSPDGSKLAWIGCRTGGLTDALYVLDGAEVTRLSEDLDTTFDHFEWAPDGRSVIAAVGERTKTHLWRIPVDGGAPRDLYSAGSIGGVALGPRGRFAVATVSNPATGWQLQRIDLKSGRVETLWDPNPQVVGWGVRAPEIVAWKSPEADIDGLFYAPEGDGPHPLIVMPHGGPDGVSTERFDGWAQFFRARGYAVLRPNYRGGVQYGRDFYAANRGRLGEIELMDIESGVDHLIAAGRVDPERLYYGGWSWGGYLTTWTLGHTQRYRAAVAGAAVTDTVAQYVGSDINHGRAAKWEFTAQGPWGEGFEAFDRANPLRHMHAIETPTLILHGVDDDRVPFAQGVTLYRALRDAGVEVDFWAYPGERHGFRDPARQVHRLETWLAWYESH